MDKKSSDKELLEQHRKAIRKFKKDNGLTTKGWADKAKIPDSTLRSYLAGQTGSPSAVTLNKLANAENVGIDELIGATRTSNNEFNSMIFIEIFQIWLELIKEDKFLHEMSLPHKAEFFSLLYKKFMNYATVDKEEVAIYAESYLDGCKLSKKS